MSFYADYYLRDNPFPATPILDPTSSDERINGTIFNPDIMSDELLSFQGKIRRRPPLIYVENSDFVRGVGKSALVVQQWRQLRERSELTSTYVRSEKRLKPSDFAARFITSWHQEGHLWPTMLKALQHYAKEQPHGEMTPSGYQAFLEAFPKIPNRRISLLNFMVYNPNRLVNHLATWAHQQAGEGLNPDLAYCFFQTYLTDPRAFLDEYPKVLRKQKWDNITMVNAVYRLMQLGGYQYHYIFLDQFEDVVHGLSGKSLISFNTEFRRLIEASITFATLIVTLHPGATNTLSSDEGGDITSIAPLDQRHVVTVLTLTPEGAYHLAETYIDHFRLGDPDPPDPMYPFTSDAIKETYQAAKGNIRTYLQALNYAVEKGADEDYAVIDAEFLAKHHSDITGRIHADDIIL
jgi:hypothetical protein